MNPLSLFTEPASALSGMLAGLSGGLTQAQRLLRLHTPLGLDTLFAEDIECWEAIGPMDGPSLGGYLDDSIDVSGHEPQFDAPHGPAQVGMRLLVHALASDAHLELKTLIGQPVLVEMLCQDHAFEMRPWHGYIMSAILMGSDGGLARYQLVIEPWLAALAYNVDAWAFQDLSVPQILDDLFSGYAGQGQLVPSWRWDLADASVYPVRSLCIQHHESDLDFVHRLMREEGLFYWWEHAGDVSSPGLGSHTLVIADHNGAIASNSQSTVRFTGSDHTLGEDSLEHWSSLGHVVSAGVAMRSPDYRGLGERPVEVSVGATPPMPELQLVDVPGAYSYEDIEQGERLVSRQAEALAAWRTRAHARGPWRRAQAGTSFTLTDHPRHDGTSPEIDTFVVLAVQHRARNNLSADERARFVGLTQAIRRDQGQGGKAGRDDDAPLHEAALLVQPRAVPVRMGSTDPQPHSITADGRFGVAGRSEARMIADARSLFDSHAVTSLSQPDVRLGMRLDRRFDADPESRYGRRPTAHGTQTALVVGGDTGDLHTDRDNRIRVQFHWQRGGGSSHRLTAINGDNAPASAGSSTWARVGQSLAGGNFGAVFTPRIGQEVLIDFTGGDIDRPVIAGAVYNGQGAPDAQGNRIATGAAKASGNAPAWFPGTQPAGNYEGHQHTASLLGHKSQELGSSESGIGGFNQLAFDDSRAGNRIELSTTIEATRLQLGALLQQQDNQRLAPRGHGLEIATDAHGALRGGSGLLISGHAQSASTRSGLQMEAEAPRQLLDTARSLVHTRAEWAQAHNARLATEPAVAGATAKDTARQLPVEQGLYALIDSMRGTDSSGGAVDARDSLNDQAVTIDGGFGSVPAWDRPDLVLAAPSGIGLFTPAAAIVTAGTHVTLSAAQDTLVVAQANHSSIAKSGAVLFTYGIASNLAKPNAETGIALHAATGSAQMSSNTGATKLTASGAINVSSSATQVLVASPSRVLMVAVGAALQIDAGSITINAPGSVEFKASMKILTSAAVARTPVVHLPVSAFTVRDVYSQKVDLLQFIGIDAEHGNAYLRIPYTVRDSDGNSIAQGITDHAGETGRFFTKAHEDLYLYLGEGEWQVFADGTGSPPDATENDVDDD